MKMADSSWFKDAIIYHIFIDRFAGYDQKKEWNKPDFLGGNIKGIIEKLPYLADLGINTLWTSPFYETSAYHGYHVTDFLKVDSHFGTLTDIKKLIKEVHKLGMHIIADFVPNHCSYQHPYFIEALKDKDSDYYKWFYFIRWPDEYLAFLSFKELPKINLDYKPARDHIIKAARYWLDLGFDGFRLDHVPGPSHRFWCYFKETMKKDYPASVLIGEAWIRGIKFSELKTLNIKKKYIKWLFGAASDPLLRSYVGELDGVLDFKVQYLLHKFIAKHRFFKPRWLLERHLKHHFSRYPSTFFLPTFLDNHDMDRFLFLCNNKKKILKEAARIQFSLRQPPIIYYGTEVGMTQTKSQRDFKEHGDIQARQPMQWENQDMDLLNFYKDLIQKRKDRELSI